MPTADDVVSGNLQATVDGALSTHVSPPLALLAALHVVFSLAGLAVVTFTRGMPFPVPWDPGATIAAYFADHATAVMVAASLQFAAAVLLGLFAATFVSRLHFLGAQEAGVHIALTGSVVAVSTMALSAIVLWVSALPVVAEDVPVIRALYYLAYALGGVGFTVPLGLFVLGASLPAGARALLPRWLVAFGLGIGACGEVSWFTLIWPAVLFLVPLTRFGGAVWLLAAGLLLPRSLMRHVVAPPSRGA